MSKNRFSQNETVLLDLGDGDTITIKKSLSFKQISELQSLVDEKNPASFALPMMIASIVSWNLKDENGIDVPCTPSNIEDLDMETCTFLMDKMTKMFVPEKKS